MRTFAFRRSGVSLTPTVPGSTSRLRSPEADKATQLLRKRISVRSLTQQEQECPPYTLCFSFLQVSTASALCYYRHSCALTRLASAVQARLCFEERTRRPWYRHC